MSKSKGGSFSTTTSNHLVSWPLPTAFSSIRGTRNNCGVVAVCPAIARPAFHGRLALCEPSLLCERNCFSNACLIKRLGIDSAMVLSTWNPPGSHSETNCILPLECARLSASALQHSLATQWWPRLQSHSAGVAREQRHFAHQGVALQALHARHVASAKWCLMHLLPRTISLQHRGLSVECQFAH